MKQNKNPRDYKVNGKQYAYVLDAIYSDDVDISSMSDKEKVKFLLDKFEDEYGLPYNKRNFPNVVVRFEQWLRGLPSVIGIAYANYDIAQIGKSWGYCQTERKTAEFVDNWWRILSARVFQLARILGVEYRV